MIQIFWLFDFLGLFFARLIVGILVIIRGFRKQIAVGPETIRPVFLVLRRFITLIHLASGLFVIFGFYSSFVSLVWIFALGFIIIAGSIKERKLFTDLETYYLLAFFLVLLFIGPGKLSLDRILYIRF
jgi:uncharacterized membrane protein YphA (DoxX/SURF4 family)